MPEDLPLAMLKAGVDRRNIPHPRTIWRAEEGRVVPHLKHRFAFAQFFNVPLSNLWPPEERACLHD